MQLSTHQHAGLLANTCRSQRLALRHCGRQATCTPSTPRCRQNAGTRRSRVLVRAEGDGAPQQDDEAARREEARIAALEKLTRSGPEQKKRQQSAAQRTERREATAVAPKGKWREGELFPQGWDRMSVPEKAWQLWSGERGFLFWSNKLALGAIVVLAVAWILFRFVGPALGLYTLTNDLLSPPNE